MPPLEEIPVVSAAQRLPDLVVVRVAEYLPYRPPLLTLQAYPDSKSLKALLPLMSVCSTWRCAALPLYYSYVSVSGADLWSNAGDGSGSKANRVFEPRIRTRDYPHLARFVRVDVDPWIDVLGNQAEETNGEEVADKVSAALGTLLKAIALAMPNVHHVILKYGLYGHSWNLDGGKLVEGVGRHNTLDLTQIRHLTADRSAYVASYSLDSGPPVLTKLRITDGLTWSGVTELVRRNAGSLENLCIDRDNVGDFYQLVDELVYPRLATLMFKRCGWLDDEFLRRQDINRFPCLKVLDYWGYMPLCLHRAIYSNGLQIVESWILSQRGDDWSFKSALTSSAQRQPMSLGKVLETCRAELRVYIRTRGWQSTNRPTAPLVLRPSITHVRMLDATFTIEQTVSIVRMSPGLLYLRLRVHIPPPEFRWPRLTEAAIASYRSTCSVHGANIRTLRLRSISVESTALACNYIVLLADLLPTLADVLISKKSLGSPHLFDGMIRRALRRPAFQASPHLTRVQFSLCG